MARQHPNHRHDGSGWHNRSLRAELVPAMLAGLGAALCVHCGAPSSPNPGRAPATDTTSSVQPPASATASTAVPAVVQKAPEAAVTDCSVECAGDGRCTAVDGICVTTRDADCQQSETCRTGGNCTARRGFCRRGGEPECGPGGWCEGVCRAPSGACTATSDQDCEQSPACLVSGRCTWSGGQCIVAGDAGCQRSRTCTWREACRAEGGRCVAPSEAACQSSVWCHHRGGCGLVNGDCVPTTEQHCLAAWICERDLRCTLQGNRCVKGRHRPPPKTSEEEPLPTPTELPAGFTRAPDGWNPARFTCGAYEVVVSLAPLASHPQGEHRPKAELRRGATIVKTWPPKDMGYTELQYCGDLTGDGTPELVVQETTGGAHCCRTATVLSLGPRVRTLLTWEARDGGYLVPHKLRKGAGYQLVGDGVVFAGAPLAMSPHMLLLPVVFELRSGRYVMATAKYRDFLLELRAEAMACKGECESYRDLVGAYTAALLGDWPKVRREIISSDHSRRELDPVVRWLAVHAR